MFLFSFAGRVSNLVSIPRIAKPQEKAPGLLARGLMADCCVLLGFRVV